ncbi:hypoxanthine phosphoribosyltransferase [Oleiphilus sp. HI0071]|uniref:phosphoribosyltransferase n=1 Tax=Oleiphilus sp. HI0080 TaxID=1822255 RepID=UPI0007C308A2|nr:phosphoribosyltransferase family protein [Oleiphilus sp. HI0080]KZY62258.1 hypoxanthine phosphoribosyltransferase [Oleiphilus sp. HI0065]KZY78717.1 hypoxanthine phosphoribosyltransferase [Oleiphilus sp. HI0071]KZZ00883.1 hypoxanthine phosphoribosyltransferase [Oleiphilus sp. HI0073]KZZ48188.1 hypoxanthine phosphoribosyltransferase [Oleiphilus sp. HI0122]KZZ48390.1 hypoxanthine phosphoribosyltransferase [Oleiphilus sp. HI0118]KZZ63834.1 hypoxanthine phosphoribosyltransferase [Oleiphilus sp.
MSSDIQARVETKRYVEEKSLVEDSYRLAVMIYESGFRPDFIVGIWRGGSTVGIYVQECLQTLGMRTDHIAIRTSYRGMQQYFTALDQKQDIRVHGIQYLLENMNHDDKLLIVDDVFRTGRHIEAVIARLSNKAKRNMPSDTRIAMPYYKEGHSETGRVPDFYLHKTDDWLVLPYELTGLSLDEIKAHKPWVVPYLRPKLLDL